MRNDPQLGGIAWIPRNKSQVDVVESSVHPTGPRTLVFIFLMIQLTWVESSESQRVVMKKEPSVGLVLSEQGVHRSWTIDKRDDRSWSSADDNSRPTAISVMNCTNINIQSMNFCKKKGENLPFTELVESVTARYLPIQISTVRSRAQGAMTW